MIFVLLALLAGLSWAIFWFVLQWGWLIPTIITAVLLAIAIVMGVLKTLRAKRAANALENAIADQAKAQAMNANPAKRAEIQALQKQIQDGINALKSSKLGGKKRGSAALYSLPWYAIIGPPGAGKTTALRHSGLVFPYADSAIRGIGGTRNCDWWFTNEAIILDTAGRYATEAEDSSEWMAFLDMLLKYRGAKPLNGLIVTISIPDVLDANEQQLETMGKTLRARIDEVMTKLRMVLPVYILVTKCDLIAGFVEFFGDLRKSERAQGWGATFMLKEDKSDPGGLFSREFDQLVSEIHRRANKRLAQERNRPAKERIYQFPLEFAGIKRNLMNLISTVFMVNNFQGTPTFRGFYFTSGTQEGLPLDRVLQRMGQAMGIQAVQAQTAAPQAESKSYFLHDVFMKVVFPDADVAARSASEVRRQQLVRVGVSAVALTFAMVLAIPSTLAFVNNRTLLTDAKKEARGASKIKWSGPQPISEKLVAMKPIYDRLQVLDKWDTDGADVDMRFLMYSGDRIYRPLIRVFVSNMQQGFVKPCKYKLESDLKGVKGEKYYLEREKLKMYLMLSDVDHLDIDYATGAYTALWAEILAPTSDLASVDLKKKLRPLVEYYFELIQPDGGTARAKPVPANLKIVERARKVLQSVPVRTRYYAFFVDSLSYEKYDPAGDDSRANRKYPPVTLDTLFTDRPKVLKWLTSKQHKTAKKYFAVEGPYTDKGHYAVLANLKQADELLQREAWVVPLTKEERGDRIAANIANLAEDYEIQYVSRWKGFLLDLNTESPDNLKDAVALFAELQEPELPYLRILRTVEDHTQWKRDLKSLEGGGGVTKILNRKLKREVQKRARLRVDVDVKRIAGRVSKVPNTFKQTVGVGVPQEGGAKTPLNETRLAKYMELISGLREKMVQKLDDQPNAGPQTVIIDLQNTVKETEALLQPTDDMARTTLLPLLQTPLNVGGKVRLSPGVLKK